MQRKKNINDRTSEVLIQTISLNCMGSKGSRGLIHRYYPREISTTFLYAGTMRDANEITIHKPGAIPGFFATLICIIIL